MNQTVSPTLSSVSVQTPSGMEANGRDEAVISAQVIDTSGAEIAGAELWIEEQSGNQFYSEARYYATSPGIMLDDPLTTAADGSGSVTVTTYHEGSLTFNVYAGAPADHFNDRGVVFDKPTAAGSGDQTVNTTTVLGDIEITQTWLDTNNGGSGLIEDHYFLGGTVTVYKPDVRFRNCTFDGSGQQYAVRALFSGAPTGTTFESCTINGGTAAAIYGFGFKMSGCLVQGSTGHGIQLVQRTGIDTTIATIQTTVIQNCAGWGVHVYDSSYIQIAGCVIDCPYSGGSDGAVYVGVNVEPISKFYLYTSWIEGRVWLHDDGLGTGPDGIMIGQLFVGRDYDEAAGLWTSDCTSMWSKGAMWEDTGALISNEEAGGSIRTFGGKKFTNQWSPVMIGTVTFSAAPAYALVALPALERFRDWV